MIESGEPTSRVHDAVLTFLGAGRLAEARALLDALAPDDPLAAVVRADIRGRRLEGPIAELRDLRSTLGATGPLVWWADAVIAERLIGELDGAGAEYAVAALAGVPAEELPTRTVLYARARLRRAGSARWLFSPSVDGTDLGSRLRDEAIADFLRGGFVEEAVMTRALAAAGAALLAGQDIAGNLARLLDARALLTDDRSHWPTVIDRLLVLAATHARDQRVLDEALERLPATRSATAVAPVDQLIDALLLTTGAPDQPSIDAVQSALDRIDPAHLRWRWGGQLMVAHWLAEAGHPDTGRYVSMATGIPGVGPFHETWQDLQRWRFDAPRGGADPDVDGLVAILEQVVVVAGVGFARHVADLMVAELSPVNEEAAARLRAWSCGSGEAAGPTVPIAPVPPPPPTGRRRGPVPVVAVSVLRPVLHTAVNGRTLLLTKAAARLIIDLVVPAPGPRHVEALGERLWPAVSTPIARQRLNGLVHRLRRRHPALGSLLVRSGETIHLDVDRCEIDLVDFHARCRGERAQRVEALASVQGNLCHVQFPYDEHLVEARHAFVAAWVALATDYLNEPELRARLAPAAAALDVGELLGDPVRPTRLSGDGRSVRPVIFNVRG